jgi:hypothetical protein
MIVCGRGELGWRERCRKGFHNNQQKHIQSKEQRETKAEKEKEREQRKPGVQTSSIRSFPSCRY